jgi:hypothetical protein
MSNWKSRFRCIPRRTRMRRELFGDLESKFECWLYRRTKGGTSNAECELLSIRLLAETRERIQISPIQFAKQGHFDQVLDSGGRENVDIIVRIVAAYFPILCRFRFIRELIPLLLLELKMHDTVGILREIEYAITSSSGPRGMFRIPDSALVDWGVFHLLRHSPQATKLDMEMVINFLASGGAEFLSLRQFQRVCLSFLEMGNDVILRVGIAFICLASEERIDDETLFRNASRLRINWKKFPLSKKKTLALRHRFPPMNDSPGFAIVHIPLEPPGIDLSEVLPSSLGLMDIPLLQLSNRRVSLCLSSHLNGTSPQQFLLRLGECLLNFLTIIYFDTEPREPAWLLLSEERCAMIVGASATLSPQLFRICKAPDKLIRKEGKLLIFLDDTSNVILSLNDEMNRLTVSSRDLCLVNYRIIGIDYWYLFVDLCSFSVS